MASSASTKMDDDLSPSEFVANIRKLGEKKDQEDAARLAALEKQIEEGRKEREMRRAERARSISPEKGSFSSRPLSRDSTPRLSRDSTPVLQSPASPTKVESPTASGMAEDAKEAASPPQLQRTASQLGRSGTLTWNQRPKSRGGEGRRPLSWMAAENAARSPRGTPEPSRSPTRLSKDSTPTQSQDASPRSPTKEMSRADIAASLGAKDPSWFRQPSDGSRGSAAMRKNIQDEEEASAGASPRASVGAGRMRLPGMNSNITPAQQSPTSPPPDSTRSSSPTHTNSIRDSTFSNSNRFSNTTANTEYSSRGMKSPPASILDAPKLDPSPSERTTARDARPPSPTKGMGGFVESAMLKRADSVSKRWSAQPGAGLARAGSNSNRNSYVGGHGGAVPVSDRTLSGLATSRENSLEPSSRPTSSHSNLTVTQKADEKTPEKDDDGFVKPAMPVRAHSRSKSVASLRSLSNEQAGDDAPVSPSKRWSPTKSSWLESALTKDEKPKPTAQAPPAQPSWMAEISKAKQQRAASPTKEVSSPFGETKSSPFGRENLKKSVSNPADAPKLEPKPEPKPLEKVISEPARAKSPPPEVVAKPAIASASKDKPDVPAKLTSPPPNSLAARKAALEAKAAPASPSSSQAQPGKFDFRAGLKSRAPPPDTSGSKEPEFKNALGNLKRTKTQNYVAPDTLKDNILRGKGQLNITGGVPERKRVDELKEQLNAQKKVIQQRKESGEQLKGAKQGEKVEEAVPEGLVRRKTLRDGGGEKEKADEAVRRAREETPEAMAALRGLQARKEKDKPSVGRKPSVEKRPEPAKESTVEPLKEFAKEKSPPPVAQKRFSTEAATSRPSSIASKTRPESIVEKEPEKPVEKSVEATTSKISAQPFAMPGMIKAGASSKLADRFNPALANMLARGPPGSGSTSKAASPGDSPALSRTTTTDEVKPGPELEHKTKGRARGPQRRAKKTTKAEEPPADDVKEETKAEAREEPKPVAAKPASPAPSSFTNTAGVYKDLHGRVPSVQLVKKQDVLSSSPVAEADKPSSTPAISKPAVSTPVKHGRVPSAQLVRDKHVLKSSPAPSGTLDTPVSKPQPTTPSKSPSLSSISSKNESELRPQSIAGRLPLREHQGNTPAPKDAEPLSPSKTRALPTPPTESPKKDSSKAAVGALFERRWQQGPPSKKVTEALAPDVEPEEEMAAPAALPQPREMKVETPQKTPTSKASIGALFQQRFESTPPSRSGNNSPTPATEDSIAPRSVRDSTALFARQESPGPFSSGRRSPIKLPTKQDEEKSMRDAGLMGPPDKPASFATGLGISAAATSKPATVEVMRGGKSPISPPLSVRASPMNGNTGPKTPMESPKPAAPAESPIPHTSEATRLFGDFFDERPVAAKDEIDTLSLLESSPLSTEKVTTIRKEMQEITGDGKLMSVASHQEHMLFDQSMYICTHSFTTAKGARSTEVYLWAGSDVSPASLEDAQLFSKRVAKDNNGKLIVISQGQETPNFMQALGGILIIFKGAKSRTSVGVPPKFVLCGRRHLGHIVFDEVDFSLHSLCSGFPYLISYNNRLYLWKGIGSHQEEVSSAKLITMDVSAVPDLIEIEEGKEPVSFFSMFPPLPKYPKNTIPRSADHWRLRPRHENYKTRLFKVEATRQKSMSLQVSSFFSSVVKRRPSWSSFGNTSQPATPTGEQTPSTAGFEPTSEQPRTPLSATPTGTVKTSINEVAPFGQGDLKADGVYVLDAFFEVYIIIGPLAQSQAPAFSTALAFAQDYGILAASMQDRPFVPVSTVVLEGAPRDMKFCFRQWENDRGVGGTEALMAGSKGIRRAGSLRCVGLAAALASLRVEGA